MKTIIIAIVCLAVLAYAKPALSELKDYTFEQYVKDFQKDWAAVTHEEHYYRKMIFENNMRMIIAHNKDETQSWKMGVNKFTDMTKAEMKRFKGLKKKDAGSKLLGATVWDKSTAKIKFEDLPDSFDWKDHDGVLTPVKNQGGCGSCWAFASTEAIESAAAINDKKQAPLLAPQQIVDCTPNPKQCGGTGGCEGATEEIAMGYLATIAGLTYEKDYQYKGRDGTCKFDKSTTPPVVSISGYSNTKSNDMESMMTALVNNGPLSVSVAAEAFQFYHDGVFSHCSYERNIDLDHAVLLTGYGTDKRSGKKFWTIRNSWGGMWGEQGYIRLLREDTAKCGTDKTPQDGDACKGDTTPEHVCGMCGVLYDGVFPKDAHFVAKENTFKELFLERQ